MKYLTHRIRKMISGRGSTHTPICRKSHPFDYVRTRKGILRELMISKQAGNLVGLVSSALGEGIFLIMVVCIESENAEEVIAFQKYDVSAGLISPPGRLSINEIQGVCSFITNHRDSGPYKASFG